MSHSSHHPTGSTEIRSWGHVNPIGPRACYDEGKRVAETLTYGFHRQDGVDVRVARIFNTYGARYTFVHCPYLSDNSFRFRSQGPRSMYCIIVERSLKTDPHLLSPQ